MKKTIIGVVILLVVLIAMGVYFSKKQYDILLKSTAKGLSIGKSYGRVSQQSDCILGLKLQYSTCNTVECELSAHGYIAGCMEAAEPNDYCRTLPNVNQTSQRMAWAQEQCTIHSFSTEKCKKFMPKFVDICTEQREQRKLSTQEHFKKGFETGLHERGIND